MFRGLEQGTWEPIKIIEKRSSNGESGNDNVADGNMPVFEEDPHSEEGAVYPIQSGRLAKGTIGDEAETCLIAFLKHIYNLFDPTPFTTPVVFVTPAGFVQENLKLIPKFAFPAWHAPALTMIDAARAVQLAYGVPTCVVIDVGFTKTDITAIQEWEIEQTGRHVSIPDTGGEAMTQRLLELLGPKNFTRDMCEQLKKSGICEILPRGVPLPSEKGSSDNATNPISAATIGLSSGQRASVSGQGGAHAGGSVTTTNVDESQDKEESEGVLDVASIVASGKTNEFLAKKEREKAEKAASKKAAAEAAAAPKQGKMQNAQRVKATFHYHISDAEEAANVAAAQGSTSEQTSPVDASAPQTANKNKAREGHELGTNRKAIEIGVERFQAADNGILDRIADAVHRVIWAADPSMRSELWNNLIITGNGTRVKGMIRLPQQLMEY